MKYARIVNNTAVDVRTESPAGCFTTNIVAEFVEVPDDVENGWTLSGNTWSAPVIPEPVIPEPVAPIPPTVGPVRFKMLFTSEERLKAKALRATDAIMDDFWGLLDDCIATDSPVDLSLSSVQQAVGYTLLQVKDAGVTVDMAARTAAILAGVIA